MQKIILSAYTDNQFKDEHGSPLKFPIDPEQISLGKNILYREDKQLGNTGGNIRFERYGPTTLSLNFVIDCSGVAEGIEKGERVYDKVKEITDLLYIYKNKGHSPSYVMVSYGELLFKGRLAQMGTKYTMFTTKGIPLQAKIELSFKGYMCSEEERKKYSKQSPDMSQLITVKAGETLPYLCHKIYGDSLLVSEVARFNNLDGFRNIPAGTELLFPPLKKE